MQRAAAGNLLDIVAPLVLKYARPAGWESWTVKYVQGTSTETNVETIDGSGGNIRVVFPDRVVPPIKVQNFSNVIMIGGSIKALPFSQLAGTDQRLINFPSANGIVHIEGMMLDGAVDGAETDGILLNGQTASVRIQNTRISGLRGQQDTNHADGFQTYIGVKEMLFDNVTITSNYQGIKFELTNTFVIDRGIFTKINIIGLSSAESGGAPTSTGGYYFWFDPAGLFPITLENFWIRPRGARPLGQSAWPGVTNSSNPCVESNNQLTWPTPAQTTGSVNGGIPPLGDYAPASKVGLNYQYIP